MLWPARSITRRPRHSSAVSMSGCPILASCGTRWARVSKRPVASNEARAGDTVAHRVHDGPKRTRMATMSTALVIVLIVVIAAVLVAAGLLMKRARERQVTQRRVETRARGAEADRRLERADRLQAEAERHAAEAKKRSRAADEERSAAEAHAARASDIDPDR